MRKVSIIVPVLDEAASIAATLGALQRARDEGAEVIVVDGGSRDATRALSRPLADTVLQAPRGRASQMNAGALAATGDVLVFLHADTTMPPHALQAIDAALDERHAWGRFDVTIDGRHPLLPIIAAAMNARSRLTGIATGDQAIFVRRAAFPGFPDIPLMEDVAFSKAMRRRSAPACLGEKALTSGRRWESRGVLRTVVLMWRLRLLYFLGVPADRLARLYRS